jgi:alpha-tubulin suppressor-like RCC1 family protein
MGSGDVLVRLVGRTLVLGSLLGTGCGEDVEDRPVLVEGLEPARRVAAGAYHTCAILQNGNLGCWGANDLGQVGVADGDAVYWSPRGVALDEDPVDVALGAAHTCAALESGTVACWGNNAEGLLAAGSTPCEPNGRCPAAPRPVVGLAGAVKVAAGGLSHTDAAERLGYTCAVTEDDSVSCWGDNREQKLGRGPGVAEGVVTVPDRVVDAGAFPLRGVVKVAAGEHRACALDTAPRVFCWGHGVSAATRVPELDGALDVAVGEDHACGIAANGAVLCWGSNVNRQSADVADAQTCSAPGDCVSSPTAVRGVSGAVALSLGGRHSCALTAAGEVVCWGSNQYGQLGRGAANLEAPPGRASVPGRAVSIAAGKAHTCAVVTDGRVYCWGLGSAGQLGRRP